MGYQAALVSVKVRIRADIIELVRDPSCAYWAVSSHSPKHVTYM